MTEPVNDTKLDGLTRLTIEYLDAQGNVQRSEAMEGTQFTLRVQGEGLHVVNAQAQATEAAIEISNSRPRWQQPLPLALILLGIAALLTTLDLWIAHNPDQDSRNYVSFALGLLGGVAAWAAVWALLGKIIAKQAHYVWHVCIALAGLIALDLVQSAMHFLSFALGWHALGRIDVLSTLFAAGLIIWAHLALIVPLGKTKHLRVAMASFTAVSIALLMWTNHRRSDSTLDTLHSPHLYRPSLQLVQPSTPEAFFTKAQSMEAILKAKTAITEPGEDNTEAE